MVAKKHYFLLVVVLAVAALCLLDYKAPAAQAAQAAHPAQGAQYSSADQSCPDSHFQEYLGNALKPDALFPVQETVKKHNPDCNFHQWSWEAFVWATALDDKGVPRFLGLPTPSDLLSKSGNAREIHVRPLKLAARGFEGTGAFVQADNNVLVAPNGYPVYGSIHMNQMYFDTAKKNLIATGGYLSENQDSTFTVGAAVFKATWLRLDPGQKPPEGAYTTEAQVPDLMTTKDGVIVATSKFKTVKVALVGLHVTGATPHHPEFLWGTFEHNLNTPEVPDNTFSTSGSNPNNYTFYKANTPFDKVNQAAAPPVLTLDPATQKLSHVTNAVLENETGGENQVENGKLVGPGNIRALNNSGQSFLKGLKGPESKFANYKLIGTVWMDPDTYNTNSTNANAVGSIYLANTTAETFAQQLSTEFTPPQNCFSCHKPVSYAKPLCPPALNNRTIALSHVLAEGTNYAIQNQVPKPTSCPTPKAGQ